MKNKIKNCFIVLAGIISLVVSIIYFAKSYYKEDYGADGVDVSFDKTYVVAIIVSLVILAYGAYRLYQSFKNEEVKDSAFEIAGFTATSVISFYNLSVFFKAMAKKKEFATVQNDFFIGLVTLCFVVYFAIELVEAYKKSNQD